MPTRARSALRSVSGAPTEMPSTTISPESICSRPLMQRISVLLPEPDGPHTTTTEPFVTVAEQSSRTRKSPKDFVTLRISIIGRLAEGGEQRVERSVVSGRDLPFAGRRNFRGDRMRCQADARWLD